MSWALEDVGGNMPWLSMLPLCVCLVLVWLSALQEKPEGGVGWLGFIGRDNESS